MFLFFIETKNHQKILVSPILTNIFLGGHPTVGILKFDPRTEKWEDVGSFSRHEFAMQAGFRYLKF